MLQTPTAVMTCESPENMRARAKAKGYQNGTQYGSLESQINYDPRFKGLLKTPSAMDAASERMTSKGESGTSGTLAQEMMSGYVEKRGFLLPTPTAIEGTKYTNTYNENSQMGQSLSAMAGSGMLPTPTAQDFKRRGPNSKQQGIGEVVRKMLPTPRANKVTEMDLNNPKMASREKSNLEEEVAKMIISSPKTDGQTFRLSPLFTQEMMGFPLGWTELPFLSGSGEQKPSKPTATQFYPK